ncbi:ParA family protein [Neisseria canis]|uniref:Protein ParA n=1 Tax=Neisseria canis TaxID=493 RepID=A0A1X3CZB7_9NEIS|nr:ParA family protein [Neisseria canis]OSI13010.1 hypothetical protein BWD07_02760 [Neisseria canis]VEF02506.1 protein ParA [Neisseria canis]
MSVSIGVIGTKGGIGKTTIVSNLGAILADMGFRVLIIDADPQASVSKYFKLHHKAPNGIVEFLLGENSTELMRSVISKTVFPNLDIILSNDFKDDVRRRVDERIDRAFLVMSKLVMPFFDKSYDFILFDTQGAVGPVQDAVALASTVLLTPIKPDVLSVREFISGTQESLNRIRHSAVMNLKVPPMKALIYAQDRTRDSRMISEEVKNYFKVNFLDGNQKLLNTIIPAQKAFKEAATLQTPVHCIEREHPGKSEPALQIMLDLVHELFGIDNKPKFFNELSNLLPEYVNPENADKEDTHD